MSTKIILIKGPQASGKTERAKQIINRESHIEIEHFQIKSALMIYGSRKYILIDEMPKRGLLKVAKTYNDFYARQITEQENPTLIICTQHPKAEIVGAEVINLF